MGYILSVTHHDLASFPGSCAWAHESLGTRLIMTQISGMSHSFNVRVEPKIFSHTT